MCVYVLSTDFAVLSALSVSTRSLENIETNVLWNGWQMVSYTRKGNKTFHPGQSIEQAF